MKLKHLSAKKLEIPFKVNFKHALANRFKTESILVSAKSFSENIGYGEGCPRSYVTNESVDTALNFIRDYKNQILGISTLQDLKSFIENEKVVEENIKTMKKIVDVIVQKEILHLLQMQEVLQSFLQLLQIESDHLLMVLLFQIFEKYQSMAEIGIRFEFELV